MTPESKAFFADATRLYRDLLDGAEWISLRLEPACQHSQIAAIEKAHGRTVPAAIARVLKSVTSGFELAYEHRSLDMGGFEFGLEAIDTALGSWQEGLYEDDEPFPFNARLADGHLEIDPAELFPIASDLGGDYMLLWPDEGRDMVFAFSHEAGIDGLTKIASNVPELLRRAITLAAPTIDGWRDFRHAKHDEIDLQSAAFKERATFSAPA